MLVYGSKTKLPHKHSQMETIRVICQNVVNKFGLSEFLKQLGCLIKFLKLYETQNSSK